MAATSNLELSPPPAFFQSRIEMFDKYKAEYDDMVKAKPRQEISITLRDGNKKTGISWETTPMDIAKEISKSLPEKLVIAKVDGVLWDLERPLEKSVDLELLDFEHPEGKQVFWHSSAHVLGEAAEKHYGCHLCFGPPTEDGFFYDMATYDKKVHPVDYPNLETLSKAVIKEKQKFVRLELPKEALLEMFKYNKYKQHFIETKVPDGTTSTVYRCGPMIDLCVGPHVPHTGRIKAFMVTKHSSSYWLGDAANDSLQRIYGISFPDTKQLKEYKEFLEQAAKRDHRKIGKDQDLWFFDEISPGSCFFLPNGVRIYNALLELIRQEYRKRGYQEVISPNIYSSKLWETSGHWDHYKENMFIMEIDKRMSALKAMNCPGHCVMFDSRDRSYRELPLRMAEFGVIHRNEASGALSGLTRVRRFVQDDSHIFCMPEQIKGEMDELFKFLDKVYSLFGFEYKLELSTRPESYLGEKETWDAAERALTDVLNEHYPGRWSENPGDGAFYGPKIDIRIQDALKRWHQCATIQLDFQLPQRFNLKYRGEKVVEEGAEPLRPVMIHRAVLGSIERFTAVITEHFGGKWPFWLSPRQVLVIPVSKPFYDYANEVRDKLWDAGLYADVDTGPETMKKKILLGEQAQYNFIFVVGQDEMEARAVNVRNRDADTKARAEIMPLDDVVAKLVLLKAERRLENKI